MDRNDIGQKLQLFRKQQGMSMRELAQKAGLTASMLSQIERGLANPSINSLRQIALALEIPLYYFFKEEKAGAQSPVVRKDQRQQIGSWAEGDVSYELLTHGGMGSIEFCMMRIPWETSSSREDMSHYGEETACLLRGSVLLTIEEQVYTLEAGDSVRIPPRAGHRWYNPNKEEAVVIFAVTPPCF